MSFITGLTRMWLTRTAKPFTFKNGYDQILPYPFLNVNVFTFCIQRSHLRSKMDMTRYCRMQNVKTLGCMFISLFAKVSATFALIAKCGILLNCVIGT